MKGAFRFWQWETLIVTMIGYALYYVIRKNLSIAMPLLGEIGISKVQLGAFLTCGGIVYGVGRFLNGIVADRNSARKVMALGLLICAAVNIAFGFSDSVSGALGTAHPAGALVWTMGILWILNSYFQGMGVGPCIKTLPQWFPANELSTKQSLWNLSHSLGAGAVFALCGWFLIPAFHSWRLCFIVPALIALAGAVAILAFWAVPTSAPLAVKLVPFLFVGFFIYGPQALLGIATTQQATPRAAGVAGGFVGIFSYASTVLSGIGFGFVAQRWGWNAAYATICGAAVIGGLVLLAMWRAAACAGR